MIRALSIAGIACLVGGFAIIALDDERDYVIPAIALILASGAIGIVLGVRKAYLTISDAVGAAHRFATGRVQHARLVEVGEPKGLIWPSVEVVLELEGEDGAKHRFERELPVPPPWAWSYRFGKLIGRRLPFMPQSSLSELLAFELRREGLSVSVGRPSAAEGGASEVRT